METHGTESVTSRGNGSRLEAEPRIVVTEHGQPVARIIPEAISLRDRVDALRKAGTIAWSGRRLRPAAPAGKVRGERTVADLVVENRE